MAILPIECLKKGEYFKKLTSAEIASVDIGNSKMELQICQAARKIVENKTVFIADGYCKSARKYAYTKFKDINQFGHAKKGTLVLTDLDF